MCSFIPATIFSIAPLTFKPEQSTMVPPMWSDLLFTADSNIQFAIADFTINSVKNLLVCGAESDNEFLVKFGKCVCHSVTYLFLLHHII